VHLDPESCQCGGVSAVSGDVVAGPDQQAYVEVVACHRRAQGAQQHLGTVANAGQAERGEYQFSARLADDVVQCGEDAALTVISIGPNDSWSFGG
jgi:hypothetical protein